MSGEAAMARAPQPAAPQRTLAQVEADLARYTAQARRLPRTHPDWPVLHHHIDRLLAERERVRPVKPSDVLAGRA